MINLFLKRVMDILGSATALVLFFPLLFIIAILVKLDSRGPVFFMQERFGLNGRTFRIVKLRTMVDKAHLQGAGYGIVKDDPRITRLGKFLRSFGIDELPQLWNVLKGDMSFVGPRPLIYPEESYSERHRKRFLMRPGITSYAIVRGRNKLSWKEKLDADAWYVEHWSFWLDLWILLRTLPMVISRVGVYDKTGEVKQYKKP